MTGHLKWSLACGNLFQSVFRWHSSLCFYSSFYEDTSHIGLVSNLIIIPLKTLSQSQLLDVRTSTCHLEKTIPSIKRGSNEWLLFCLLLLFSSGAVCFETGSNYVILLGLSLTVLLRMASDLQQSSCVGLQNAGVSVGRQPHPAMNNSPLWKKESLCSNKNWGLVSLQ